MIRLYIIEDHQELVVGYFRHYFRNSRDGIGVTGSAGNPDEAKNVNPGTFDIFILDLFIPGTMPVENIRKLKEYFPGKPILIFTSENDPGWKHTMMSEGAMAYITKNAPTADLRYAIKKVFEGKTFFPGFTGDEEKKESEKSIELRKKELTIVQKEILSGLKIGLKHKEIAKQQDISISNIDKTLALLRIRYNVKNTIELINLMSEMGEI
jgi:two-component system, NarL family, response regulator NreC